jgi:hypothetical protein
MNINYQMKKLNKFQYSVQDVLQAEYLKGIWNSIISKPLKESVTTVMKIWHNWSEGREG